MHADHAIVTIASTHLIAIQPIHLAPLAPGRRYSTCSVAITLAFGT